MSKNGQNIYQRKDGRWEGRYIKERVDGKARYGYVYGKSFREVEDKLRGAAEKADIDRELVLFRRIAADWLEQNKPQLKPASVARYSNILNSYLMEPLGDREIQAISRKDLYELGNALLLTGGIRQNGLSPKTVNSILSVVKSVFRYASTEKGYLVADIRNVCVKQPQNEIRVLSRAEQQKLSGYLQENISPCNLGILLCLYTGLRIGEICALKWMDIHIPEQYLYVHQAMQRIQMVDGASGKTEICISKPKSDCSVRRIPLPDEMNSLLKAEEKPGEAFVLTGLKDKYIEPRCMENYFKRTLDACGLKDVNYHALRHTFATRCVELGFDIKSLSEILGHSSVNITLNRYVHPSMELKQRNMNRLSELLAMK